MPNHKNLIEAISRYQPHLLDETSSRASVMVILLLNEDQEFEIVLTKRSSTLPTYAGDYSFPGGMHDMTDVDLYATAGREIQEELNLSPDSYQRIGQLDDFEDRFGHLVRPFVVTMNKNHFIKTHKIHAAEISEIYYFLLNKLDEIKDDPKLHDITRRQPSYSYTDGPVFIWGLTAAILVHLSNIIFGTNKALGKIPSE